MLGPHCHRTVFWQLVRNMHTSSLLEVIFQGSGSVPLVSPTHRGVDTSPTAGWLLFKALYSFPCVMACLPISPLCFWNCAGRHNKPTCNSTYRCAILGKLDYLCHLISLQVLLMLTLVTWILTKHKQKTNHSGRIRWKQLSVATTC